MVALVLQKVSNERRSTRHWYGSPERINSHGNEFNGHEFNTTSSTRVQRTRVQHIEFNTSSKDTSSAHRVQHEFNGHDDEFTRDNVQALFRGHTRRVPDLAGRGDGCEFRTLAGEDVDDLFIKAQRKQGCGMAARTLWWTCGGHVASTGEQDMNDKTSSPSGQDAPHPVSPAAPGALEAGNACAKPSSSRGHGIARGERESFAIDYARRTCVLRGRPWTKEEGFWACHPTSTLKSTPLAPWVAATAAPCGALVSVPSTEHV
ncbi:hypothetical protein G6O67_001407 [Ophiocordyceps sinensis]|uniref:Uncharacterized protein n=1 Tax=Ophiocordyceps sinensis TaxID=72228 RepID=A0A8H4PXH6_9HYPO|nr:hypothetical protein G6O67_001407 [Ophiocordyceps sinensis]